jgi:hypothetical protein
MKELTEEQKKTIEEVETMLDNAELNDVVLVRNIGAPRPHKPTEK